MKGPGARPGDTAGTWVLRNGHLMTHPRRRLRLQEKGMLPKRNGTQCVWMPRSQKLRLLGVTGCQVPGPICLLCAERRPEDCHRALIAQYLASVAGKEVEHLVP